MSEPGSPPIRPSLGISGRVSLSTVGGQVSPRHTIRPQVLYLLAQDRQENPGAGAHVAVFAASLDSWVDLPAVHPQPSRPGEADEQCRATAASSQSRLNQEVLLRTTSVVVILLLSLACSTAAAPTPVSTPAPALEPTPVPIAAPMPTPTPTAMSVSPVTPSPPPIAASPTDRGLTITPENRCSPYDPDDYRYSQSVEPRIVASMGGTVYGPYTGRVFSSTRETDIEHIVARSEAHDSGLCAANPETRNRFASDLLNLTLAAVVKMVITGNNHSLTRSLAGGRAAPTVQGGSARESHPGTPNGSAFKPPRRNSPPGQPGPDGDHPAGAALQAPVSTAPGPRPSASIRASRASSRVR